MPTPIEILLAPISLGVLALYAAWMARVMDILMFKNVADATQDSMIAETRRKPA